MSDEARRTSRALNVFGVRADSSQSRIDNGQLMIP